MYNEIDTYFKENKIPSFRFKQLENAIFKQFVNNFNEITVFSKELRETLANNFKFSSLELVEMQNTVDTVKFILKTFDNQYIESVLMLHNDKRRTVCVSCQIFCSLGCKFCATGANKFKRNLNTQEIIEQVLFVSRYLKSQQITQKNKNEYSEYDNNNNNNNNNNNQSEVVTNVVFMGMGEPFLNYENVIESIKILNSDKYFNIGARHITVSTAGIVPQIYDFVKLGLQVRLAISLHAPNDKIRTELMPINKTYNITELLKATDSFSEITNKRVSFEYVLIADINDSNTCAKELVNLMKDRLVLVNLLVYNPHSFADFKKPSMKRVSEFKNILINAGIECSIRKSMGDDVSGACGQLAGKR